MTTRWAAGVAFATLGFAVPVTSAQAGPKLHDGAYGFKVRPATILVSGDGSGWLGGRDGGQGGTDDYGEIRWQAFRRSGARGKGRIVVGDCDPTCATARSPAGRR